MRALDVKVNHDNIAVQNTVKFKLNAIDNIIMFSGKFISVPTIVSLIDSVHAALSDLFILLKCQTDRFAPVHLVCSASI